MTIDIADPWKPITPPDQSSNVSGRRVDPELQWGLFWAVDADRNCLLILQHDSECSPEIRLPKMHGLQIETRRPDDTRPVALIIIRLVETEQREIFHRLCLDIVSATRQARTEVEAIERFLARTWRWHRLLRGGQDGRLSDEEQKCLIGELEILRRLLIPITGAMTAVKGWTGPLGAPKDFEIGRVCIEAKARRGAATPFVTVSSEFQMDTDGIDALFLHVSELTGAPDDDDEFVTVTDIARRVLDGIEAQDVAAVEIFEERLTSTGFDWEDDYTDKRWIVGPTSLYEIANDFPRITPAMFSTGVGNVRYAISLPDCEPYRSDEDRMRNCLTGALDGYDA